MNLQKSAPQARQEPYRLSTAQTPFPAPIGFLSQAHKRTTPGVYHTTLGLPLLPPVRRITCAGAGLHAIPALAEQRGATG